MNYKEKAQQASAAYAVISDPEASQEARDAAWEILTALHEELAALVGYSDTGQWKDLADDWLAAASTEQD